MGHLTDLAKSILASAEAIEAHLEKTNTPIPSFEADSNIMPDDMEIIGAKLQLQTDLQDLDMLALGPREFLTAGMIGNVHDVTVINVLNQFNFWDAVPLKGSITYADLASKVKLPEALVRRLLRFSMTRHMFASTSSGSDSVKHTSVSAIFVLQPQIRCIIGHQLEEIAPACINVPQALRHWNNDAEHPSKSGCAYTFFKDTLYEAGTFEWFGKPENAYRVERFAGAMNYMMQSPAMSFTNLHNMYDWRALGAATLVDVGGSEGHISYELARAYPDMKFIVQDLPEVQASFDKARPSELDSRVSFTAHNFFKEQPVKGAEVYFMKHILHDWSDPWAAKIIQQLTAAMKPGSKLILCEGVLPPADKAPAPIVRLLSALDMQMLVALNAKERTVEDWQALLKLADERLVFKGVHQPPGVGFAIIEAEFAG
ncbi:S-adenosyl-L-methionine-dependent methyltransferase [Microthyrium microscopicum]|uniref:S-adenosyl-L-methionine-dependent methyltransferase n=1 Tax=Microthyrium microscopicum TaxID=703497 RepID=A0A6A6UMS0_9PEZI|nr:S-adenosyl-L-methionine-dependent methyltransferase [Microthyrium microscopicum]